ncbi:UNVERIFIED_CONTAM: hypothetical protein K2H54_004913 [Gekko kuhli]
MLTVSAEAERPSLAQTGVTKTERIAEEAVQKSKAGKEQGLALGIIVRADSRAVMDGTVFIWCQEGTSVRSFGCSHRQSYRLVDVENATSVGDMDRASSSSRTARMLNIIGIVLGVIAIIFVIVIYVVILSKKQ